MTTRRFSGYALLSVPFLLWIWVMTDLLRPMGFSWFDSVFAILPILFVIILAGGCLTIGFFNLIGWLLED